MKFRPCIDIHNGKVKQIIGGTLRDEGNSAVDNFVSDKDGAYYGRLYREKGLNGGHIILLNKEGSEFYDQDLFQAKLALSAFPGGMMIGGGVNDTNARTFLDMGASHVIVTSFVFRDGMIDYERLDSLISLIGKEHLVLDLSCRKKEDGKYYIVTDRWQRYTDCVVDKETLCRLSKYADEYLIHAVDVEGKHCGIDEELIEILSDYDGIPITYAGGVSEYDDIDNIKKAGAGRLDVTVGSALDIFGGKLSIDRIIAMM